MEIQIVIPICHADIELGRGLIRTLLKFGGVTTPLFVFTWKAQWDKDEFLALMPEAKHYVLETENEMGWPEAPTFLFQQTAWFMHNSGNDKPWYFLEADCLPLRPGWKEAMEQEYEEAGKPYMGVITPTMWVNKQTGEKWTKGAHMVGTGIYPPDFVNRCPNFDFVDEVAWDIAIGDEILPEVHHTDLIAHRWNTRNYRYNSDGVFIMDDIPKEFVDSRVKAVDPKAAVVHGCKDFSLYNLLNEATV